MLREPSLSLVMYTVVWVMNNQSDIYKLDCLCAFYENLQPATNGNGTDNLFQLNLCSCEAQPPSQQCSFYVVT
jgi:hypothetical protein